MGDSLILSPMDSTTIAELQQLRRLLAELHLLWQQRDYEDHHKSQDGRIELYFPSWFNTDNYETATPKVMVYSYLFGPSRNHYFDNLVDAITAVKEWDVEYRQSLNLPNQD